MTLTPPPEFPDWATNDVTDPISNVKNVITPALEMQQSGWLFQQFPPRQWFNWLARYTGRWIRYLAQNDQKGRTISFTGTYGNSYVICDTSIPSILMVYINDTASTFATSSFVGICNPFSATASNRTINPLLYGVYNAATLPSEVDGQNNHITVSQINNATGAITVSTGTASPGPFQLVAVQYFTGA